LNPKSFRYISSAAPAVAIATNAILGSDKAIGHTIVSLADGRRLAVLALTDRSHLSSNNKMYDSGQILSQIPVKDNLMPRSELTITSYRQAIAAELHMLSQLEDGSPDVIVCIVNGIHFEQTVPRENSGVDGDGESDSAKSAVIQLAYEAIEVDIFIVIGVRGLTTPSQ
jgi:hypothetical protein